ncbi:predicted protein [Naegleria gruberi]|uniref:Predicted protein n=1 Tax=Naegleria gruberi TaxID=5762 RepID=D2VC83_NAEGR|nr:uncharacterized protein NAEGRDRAFT_66479 [Naegleria gruberi]EFC45610.1 predicted protein [Naegleria gruberi]|eukprot:XP_002678354.1 predicted protein [Naegleria gruberi strain NEG-M]
MNSSILSNESVDSRTHIELSTSPTSISSPRNVNQQQSFKDNSPPQSASGTHFVTQPESTVYSSATGKKDSNNRQSTKSEQSSMKTPRNSSATGFRSRTFRWYTCCGVLEMNCLKLTSLVALVVSLVSFVALLAIISVNYSIARDYQLKLANLSTSGTFYRELMKLSCRAAVTSSYNKTLSLEFATTYNQYFTTYYSDLGKLVATVPPSILYWNKMNITMEELKSRKAVRMELAMIANVKTGNYSTALASLESDTYKGYLTGYQEEVQSFINYAEDMKSDNEKMDLTTTTVSLIVICISLVIVIPILLAFMILSLRKDDTKEKQLRQVKKYMIMDTINDSSLVEKFKEFCKQERSEENFVLLEKINEYKKLCEKSFDIQVVLYDTGDALSISDVVSDTTASSQDESTKKKNKHKKGFTEKDLQDIEKKKFEIAFEIYSEFLDIQGDHAVNISKQFADVVKLSLDSFAKGENEYMPETLFESIEYEMCLLMMDTHHRFKQHMEVQLKQKKQVLSTLKRKPKK